MKIKKQDLRENIEQLIGDGVINGEEIDITTEKVLTLTYTIIDYLEAKIKEGETLPNIYKLGELNTKRIAAYRKFAELYDVEEGTIRDAFCKGADWYKELIENNEP